MGSAQCWSAGATPQQELPPLVTRRAAWPYLSLTTSLMSVLMTTPYLSAKLNDLVSLDSLRPGAAFREEKCQQVLQRIGVRRVAQETALAFHGDNALVLQLVQMMRKVRRADPELRLNLARAQSFRVRRQEEL